MKEDRIITRSNESFAAEDPIGRFRAQRGGFPSTPPPVPTNGNASGAVEGDREGGGAAHGSRLWMRSRGQVQVIDVENIEWVESELRYCWIHLRNGERRRFREPISRMESRLDPARFARVHRSVIVNLDCVAQAISSATTKAIILKSGTRLPMSRSRRHRVFDSLVPER